MVSQKHYVGTDGHIYGEYDAQPDGFAPGSISLHNCMLPHGLDKNAFEQATTSDLKPHKLDKTMSFMFETCFPQHLTEYAAKEAPIHENYIEVWEHLEKKFDGPAERK